MMIYLIFVIFVIDDRISDSDRSRRYSWYFDSVSDSDSLLTIVTIFLVGLSLGKIMIYLIFVIIVIDDRISDSDRFRRYLWVFDSVSHSDSLLAIVTIFLAGLSVLTISTIFLAGRSLEKMMIYLIFVIFVIDDRISDSDRFRRYLWVCIW